MISLKECPCRLLELNQSFCIRGPRFDFIVLCRGEVSLGGDHFLHCACWSQTEFLPFAFKYLARECGQPDGGVQLTFGLLNRAHCLTDVPYSLVLGLLQLHLKLLLF